MSWDWEKLRDEHQKKEQSKPPIKKSTSTKILAWFDNNMIVLWILIGVLMISFIFGMAYVVKHLSYWWWYEDLVKATINEMVKPEYLIHLK